jgi:uncharacterized protein (UPF0332 family)
LKQEFLSKAKESLKGAEILFENGLYDDCVSRAYYAAFRAAVAVLAQYGIKSENNDHKWLQAAFTRELIHRRKIFSAGLKSCLPELIKIRIQADYKISKISKKQAKHQLGRAKEFVEAVEKEINR